MKEVYSFLDKLKIDQNETLIVAVSYGPDSMFLLDILKSKYNKNKIVCAHVHHNHRKESDMEARLLEKYCSENNIIFEFMKIKEYKNNNFTEIEARKKRYNFFYELIKKYNSSYLFTAHHGDDLIETVLMKITRGSTMQGFSGINLISKREDYKIIRPLLYLTKEEIINYCDKNKIPYAVDNSNFSLEYTRNRYRINVLPYLKQENKNIHIKFLSFSNEINEYNEFVNKVVDEKYIKAVNNGVMDVISLKKEDDLIIRKVIEKYLFENYGENIVLVDKKNIRQVINMIKSNKSNIKIDLPDGKKICKSYNKIYFDNSVIYNEYCYLISDKVKLPNGYVIRRIKEIKNTSNYTAAFSSSEIKMPLYVRNKKNGDKVEILNLSGTKKLKDIFIDEKIDKSMRNNYPVLVDSCDNILWIPGIKKSKYDKSKTKKYDIILEYVKED